MKILIVADDVNLAENISPKLVFLRTDDIKVIASTLNIAKNEDVCNADVILLFEGTTLKSTLNLVKKVRKNTDAIIMLVVNSNNSDLILDCIDNGADDFIQFSAHDFEYVVRIVKNLKYRAFKSKLLNDNQILKKLGITDNNGIYKRQYSKTIIENFVEENNLKSGSYMIISPSLDSNYTFSNDKLIKAIKTAVRSSDIYILGKGVQHTILLPYTDMNGALTLFNRIKESVKFDITAGISDIADKSYDEFEKASLTALTDALASRADYNFAQNSYDDTLNNWLDNTSDKGYKIFQKVFDKKLKKVIQPVFSKLQKTYDGKLKNAQIYQIVNDDACFFRIISDKNESTLRILYKGFSKIVIYISYTGLDSPENMTLELQLNEITKPKLVDIVENFIKNINP